MHTPIDLDRLSDFFPAEDIEWRPMRYSPDGRKALAAAYVTNRAIMDRLDDVCGRVGWTNTFQAGPDGGVVCGLSVLVDGQWITKWDGAENTEIEPVKGGLSSSMRRAAVQWGIGRYLYRLPMQWVPVDERGHFKTTPQMDPAFLPQTTGDGAVLSPTAPASQTPASQTQAPAPPEPSPAPTAERTASARSTAKARPTRTAEAKRSRAPERTLSPQADPRPSSQATQKPRNPRIAEPQPTYTSGRKKRLRSDADQYFMPGDLPF